MSDSPPTPPGFRDRAARRLRVVMEGSVLLLVVLSPWAFGGVDPQYEFLLDAGVAVLLALWAARMLVEGRLSWQRCPVAVGLAALFLWGAWQLAPLPRDLLARIAPATARLYHRLLPERPEELPAGEGREAAVPAPGSTLSLYPHATRRQVVQLLAVFLVFAAVRNNSASAAGLRRLSVVALTNGALLSLFGLVQFFTSPPHVIYWTDQTKGLVFGPFINRDHFAFYINLCIGLGVGLLLSRASVAGSTRGTTLSVSAGGLASRKGRHPADGPSSVPSLLHDPPALWICLALVIMLTGVLFCLSRGGFLALLAGAFVSLAVRCWRSPRFVGLQATLLVVVATLALLAWFGFERIGARLETLWQGEALKDDRVAVFQRSLPLVQSYPVWGTGYGTFPYVEPLRRTDAKQAGWVYEHAHNEYLEAVVEGGIVRLVLSLLIIGLIFRLGYRAFCRHERQPAGGLVLGALFAFTTLVFHSAVEFAIHIPAVALLATVLCANLGSLGGARGSGNPAGTVPEAAAADRESFRLGGLAPAAGAVTLVLLGLILCGEGRRADRVWRIEKAALRLRGVAEFPGPEQRITLLRAAVRLDPSNARMHHLLGEAHADLFDQQAQWLDNYSRITTAAEAILSPASAGTSAPWVCAPPFLVLAGVREPEDREVLARLVRRHQIPAVRHYLLARDLCPLDFQVHVQIAIHISTLAQNDARGDYLERATFLDPTNPDLWFRCGILESQDGRPEQTWKDWRRSLELSDHHFPEILDRSRARLSEGEVLEKILPDRPGLLLRAAFQFHPRPEEAEERKPFLVKALDLLAHQTAALEAEDYHIKAAAHRDLGQPQEALSAYRAALVREPGKVAWRYELAGLLFDQGRWPEARRELLTVLEQQPGHSAARDLLEAGAKKF